MFVQLTGWYPKLRISKLFYSFTAATALICLVTDIPDYRFPKQTDI